MTGCHCNDDVWYIHVCHSQKESERHAKRVAQCICKFRPRSPVTVELLGMMAEQILEK